MPEPAYLVFIFYGWKDAWYRLSKEERKEIMTKCGSATKDFGGERLFGCKSPGGFPGFGAVVYPDMDSLMKSIAAHAEFDWPDRYATVTHLVGTKL